MLPFWLVTRQVDYRAGRAREQFNNWARVSSTSIRVGCVRGWLGSVFIRDALSFSWQLQPTKAFWTERLTRWPEVQAGRDRVRCSIAFPGQLPTV